MVHWNYRIFKQEDGSYGVHEVFYGSSWVEDGPNGPKISWTEPVVPEGLWAEDLKGLRSIIKQVYEDTNRLPIIDEAATLKNDFHEITIEES